MSGARRVRRLQLFLAGTIDQRQLRVIESVLRFVHTAAAGGGEPARPLFTYGFDTMLGTRKLCSTATLALLILSSLVTPALARPDQDLPPTQPALHGDDAWHFSITPYIWLPSVDTSFSLDGIPENGDNNTSGLDLFNELEFALMCSAEVRKGKVGVLADFMMVKLGNDFSTSLPRDEVLDSDFDLTLGTASTIITYRIVDDPKVSFDCGAGARLLYTSLSADLDLTSGASSNAEQSVTVVDPIVAIGCNWRFANKWSLTGYGDIGGFGVGTDLTWQAVGSVDYHFTEHFILRVGYRVFAIDLDISGMQLDTVLYGPAVGFVFAF